MLTLLLIGPAVQASATAYPTRDGHEIVLGAFGLEAHSIPPLDNSPLSREALLTSDVHAADLVLSGIELSATNALGPVSVRPYAKISVTTGTGVYVHIEYGDSVQL